jgi:hypothetical protein
LQQNSKSFLNKSIQKTFNKWLERMEHSIEIKIQGHYFEHLITLLFILFKTLRT